MTTKTIELSIGQDISSACEIAVEIAKREDCNVAFDFNEVALVATPDTDPSALKKHFWKEVDRRHQEYIASPEYKSYQEKVERENRERRAKVEDALAGRPAEMSLRDPEEWAKAKAANSDPYGGAVIVYAERWARLMEARMAKGERLGVIADECSRLANEEGITGFMYGCAVSVLAVVWEHGEELRRWHNIKTQIRDEGQKANENGGVLNPACLRLMPQA